MLIFSHGKFVIKIIDVSYVQFGSHYGLFVPTQQHFFNIYSDDRIYTVL